MAQLLAGERGRDVALAVTGADEHQRHDVDRAVPLRDEPRHGVLDGRRRELEEAALDVGVRRGLRHALHQLGELRDAVGALGAVADDEQGGPHAGAPSGREE